MALSNEVEELGPELPPPERLNATLIGAILVGGTAIQWLASHARGWPGVVAAGVALGFLYLPLYSLLHDAEHRVLFRSARLNDALGVLLASFFPAPFSFLRACHLGHHRRNRSEVERFDLCYPHESRLKRGAIFYALYLGGFWFVVVLSTALFLIWPRAMLSSVVQDAPPAAAMINGIPRTFVRRIRLEALATVLLHAALIALLELRPGTYAVLYCFHGLWWSAHQYIAHADSPRHVLNGAHNLRAHRLYELLLLNFNWHLAHHQHPRMSWNHLPRFDDPTRVRPGYLISFLRFWRGPRVVAPPPELFEPSVGRPRARGA